MIAGRDTQVPKHRRPAYIGRHGFARAVLPELFRGRSLKLTIIAKRTVGRYVCLGSLGIPNGAQSSAADSCEVGSITRTRDKIELN
jgi:hypothetical protein